MKRSAFFLFAVLAGAFCASISITGTIRDFTPAHPDFERFLGSEKGIVQNTLDVDGKPILSAGTKATVTSSNTFSQWYRDVDGVNIPVSYTIVLEETAPGSGVYSYTNDNFFPIDDMAFGNWGSSGHNFHFTSEFKNMFTYMGGEVFTFQGDDDVWVFINNKLALDLGGVHGVEQATIQLDALASTLGITVGNSYSLTVFHAERHTTQSNFRIDTTIMLESEEPEAPTEPGRDAYICEVYFPDFCPGDPIDSEKQAACPADPTLTIGERVIKMDNFNAISFDGFFAVSGDVEGRAAIKNKLDVSSYTFGYELRTGGVTAIDNELPFSLVVGGDASFNGGSVHPDGSGYPYPGAKETIHVGGTFTAPSYLQEDKTSGPCAGCLDDDFTNAQAYYTALSNAFASVPDNIVATLQYGGITLTCSSSAPSYSVSIDSTIFSQITYWTLAGCNNNSQIVINIGGTGEVKFSGDNIYHRQERVLYNVLGSGRTIKVETEVRGSILGPNNKLQQTGGVIKGLVIVGNVAQALQINRVNCVPPPLPPTPPTDPICVEWEAQCDGLLFPLANEVHSFRDFNGIVFGDFKADTGDIEGRLAVQGSATFGTGYSVGHQLQTAPGLKDNSLPYSLVVGRDLTWGGGSIHPDGTGNPYPGDREDMFVGGAANVPAYLTERRSGGPCGSAGCLDAYFEAAQECYTDFQEGLLAHSDNVQKNFEWSGLFITCNDVTASNYYVTLTAANLASITYTTVDNCNVQANWAINIIGTDDVVLTGGSFPGVPGGVVYNIVGQGRTVFVYDTEVRGHILAPHNYLNQTGGVILGKVVAGNVLFSLQINRENTCPDDTIIEVPIVATERVADSQTARVAAFRSARAGDTATINGEPVVIVSVSETDQTVGFSSLVSLNEGDLVMLRVSSINGRHSHFEPTGSSAASLQVAFALLAFLALFF